PLQDHGSQVYTSKRRTLHGQHRFSLAGSSNMKRAVSSMDAWGVRQQGGGDEHVRLKRCKSAFANLKALSTSAGAVGGGEDTSDRGLRVEHAIVPRLRNLFG
ncbi:unnamed protein product, partial [Ectocarpus sp. 12 AP-2014]